MQRIAAAAAGVPAGAVRAVTRRRTAAAAVGQARLPGRARPRTRIEPASPTVVGLRELFADVLQIDADGIDPDASFVDLGGNSLSYVTMSVRLERALGRLPADWQRLPLRELERMPKPARRSWPWLGCDAGDQRRAARRRDRAHRRIARRAVRAVGRRAPAARHRGLQLRPVLPHAGAAHATGCATCATPSPGSR